MENKAKYHGSTLKDEEAARALEELGLDNPIPALREKRKTFYDFREPFCPVVNRPQINLFEAVQTVHGRADNFDVPVLAQDFSNDLAHERRVIHDEGPHRRGA